MLLLLLAVPLVLAANDPGHDSLYVLKIGDSNVTGNINITGNLTAQLVRVTSRFFGDNLDIRADGTTSTASNFIKATTTDLEIGSGSKIILNGGGTVVQVGSVAAPANLNVTGSIYQGASLVCLQNGSNCPAVTGDNTSWTEARANTLYYPMNTNPQGYYNSSTLPATSYQSSAAGWTNSTTSVWLANNNTNVSVGYSSSLPVLYVDNANGRIGLKTSRPRTTLEVNGTAAISSASPSLTIDESDASADNKLWMIDASNENLQFFTINDALTVPGYWLIVNRTSTTVDQVLFPNGNVGIGTALPTQKLDVNGSLNISGVSAKLYTPELCLAGNCQTSWPSGNGLDATSSGWRNSSNQVWLANNATNISVDYDSGIPLLFIDTTNNRIGINTTNTNGPKLEIQAGSTPALEIYAASGGSAAYVQNSASHAIYGTSSANGGAGVYGETTHSGGYGVYSAASTGYAGYFSGKVTITGNTTIDEDTLFVDSTANRIGIGTTIPAYSLHVNTSTNTLIAADTSSPTAQVQLNLRRNNVQKAAIFLDANNDLAFAGAGGSLMVLNTSSGNFGIGTSAPGQKLDVNGNIKLSAIGGSIIGAGGAGWFDIYQGTSDGADNQGTRIGGGGDVSITRGAVATFYGNEHATLAGDLYLTPGTGGGVIINNGDVGIGTTAPGAKLDVVGTINATTIQTSGTTRISSTGVGTFATGTTVNSQNVCLADGTNCPTDAVGGNVSSSTTSTDNAVVRWDGTTGFVVQNSGVTIDDSSNLGVAGIINADATATAISSDGDLVFTGSGDIIDFSDDATDKVHWYSNTYGTGIESNTLTDWSAVNHRWRIGGTSVSGGTERMLLNNTALYVNTAINSTNTVTANTFTGAGTGLSGTASSLTAGNANQLVGQASTYFLNITGFAAGNITSGTVPDARIASAATWSGKAGTGTCAAGTVAQNTTTSGVQCVAIASGTVGGSGTAGNISYWTGASTLASSVIYQSGSNIGINTSTPSAKLHIEQGSVYPKLIPITETAIPSTGLSLQAGPGATNPQGWAYPYGTRLSVYSSGGRGFEIMTTTYPDGQLAVRTANSTPAWDNWKLILDSMHNVASSGNLQIAGSGPHYISNGNIGIGTTAPGAKLDVVGTINATTIQTSGTTRIGSTGVGTFATGTTINSQNVCLGDGTNCPSISGASNAAGWTNTSTTIYTLDNNDNVAIGTATASQKLTVAGNANISGNIYYGGNLTGYGADLAEYVFGEGLDAGDVVILDPDRDKGVIRSSAAYDTRAAGIISTDPSHLMSADEGNVPLALSGRVPVKVTAENGQIRRGDLLTTSNTPGHAMKCSDRVACSGAIIGKAMENLNTEKGMITALVVLG
jgi:hypothetical protein